MKKVNKKLIGEITLAMYSKARDADISVYNSIIYEDNLEMVILALSMYQKQDGGFGNNIDVNNYNPNSTVLSTSIALNMIYKSGIRKNFEDEFFKKMVHDSYKYLFKTAPTKNNMWVALSEDNNKYPCAKWLLYNEENLERFLINPTAELLGYGLLLLEDDDPYYSKCINKVEDTLKDYLNLSTVNKYQLYSVNILLEAIKDINVFDLIRSRAEEKMIIDAKFIVSDENCFGDDDAVHPIEVFFNYTKDEEINNLINKDLDYLITSIPSYKLYEPKYSWGIDVPEADTALLKAFGLITTNYISIFKKFGRLTK